MPFNKPRDSSFNKRLIIGPIIVLLAIPCTIIAEDWTPTFPAIAAIRGVNKNNFGITESSICRNNGNTSFSTFEDILGNSRATSSDIGAYQYLP